MIEVHELTKNFADREVVKGISFSAEKGQIVGFLGPNGAGKTTTMRILTGFLPASSGTASIAGFDVQNQAENVRRHIGYLPENPPLYLDMTAHDYLTFVARLKGVPRQKMSAACARAIEMTNLGDVQNRVLGNLSKGFRQRVGIAQAIVHEPAVLILDEPTVGLDPRQIIEIRDLIRSLRGAHTIILSTHILPEVTATCEKIIIINEGRITRDASMEEIRLEGSLEQAFLDALKSDHPEESRPCE